MHLLLKNKDSTIDLKLLMLNDAEDLLELINGSRNYLCKWVPWMSGIRTIEDSREFIRSMLKEFSSNSRIYAGIWWKSTFVGGIELHTFDWLNRKTSIGYWLGEHYQGNGIVTEATRCMIDIAFNNLGLNRVEIRAAVNNYRSRAVPERLGFQSEGVIREAEWLSDHFVDHIVYGMLAAQWRSRT